MLGKTTYQRVIITTAIVTGAALVIAALIWLMAGTYSPDRRAFVGRAGEPVDQRVSLPLGAVSLLSIEAVSEDVHLIEGSGDTVEAWLHGTIRAGSSSAVPKLVTGGSGSTAEVKVQHATLGGGPYWADQVLEVRVPPRYAGSLRVSTVSGTIDAADHAFAGFELATTSGEITAGSISANQATFRTVSGGISAEAVKADTMSLHTTSGGMSVKSVTARDIEITSVSGDAHVGSLAGSVAVHTTSGEVEIGCASVPPRMTVGTNSGDVSISLPTDAVFALDAHSTSGEIQCDFPITIAGGRLTAGKHNLTGTVGGSGDGGAGAGMPAISVRTTSGDIKVKR